ncbi:MAG: hypothetical protein PHI96_07930 [Desulfovibrio sp.]|nr:hypothetical protein [Desulfovibrio sp.]
MKKLLTTLIILIVLVAGGLTALGFGLRSTIEQQLLGGLGNMAVDTQGKPYVATADQLNFSPFTREVSIRGLAVRGEQPEGQETWLVSEASFRLPVRMMLALTPLRGMVLDGNNLMDIAENVVVRNASMTTPNSRVTVQRKEVDVIRAKPSVVTRALDKNEPIDMVTAMYNMGAGNSRAFFVTADIIDASASIKTSVKEVHMAGWQENTIASLAVDGLVVRVDGTQGLSIGHFRQEGIVFPEESLMRQLLPLCEAPDSEKAQQKLMPLVETMLNAEPPLMRKFQASDMDFAVETSSVQVKEVQFEWLSNAPSHTRSSITGLTASSSLLYALLDMTLPPLNMNMAFESQTKGTVSHKKATVESVGMGQLACSLNMNENPGTRMPEDLLTQSFSDFTLSYKDAGATAWLGLNISPSVPEAVAALEELAALPGIKETPQNKAIQQGLQAFASKPGSLDIQTTPGRTVFVLDLLAMLDNPGMLLTLTAQQGSQSLTNQMEGLQLTFEAMRAMNEQQDQDQQAQEQEQQPQQKQPEQQKQPQQ